MATKVGIWMDKRTAKIISGDNGGQLLTTVQSDVEEFNPKGGSGSRFKGGPQDVVQDSKYTEREKQQLKAYFQKVAEELPDLEKLVVFGPAQTGKKFADELARSHKDLYQKIRGVEKADSMTENQVVAWVREYFK